MSLDPRIGELLVHAERQFEEGSAAEIDRALERLDAELRRVQDPQVEVELRYCAAGGLVVLGDHRSALSHYEVLRRLDPEDPDLDYWEAVSLFHTWRFDEARHRLRRHRPGPETAAGAVYYEGLLLEFEGEFAQADRRFARAAQLDPRSYHVPFRLEADQVESRLAELVRAMPLDVQRALTNVQLSVAALPEPAVHDRADVDPLVLGLYTGASMMEQDAFGGSELPERVEVFQRNVERVSRDETELLHELDVTLKHEVGHHLGWDEDDLADRGLA